MAEQNRIKRELESRALSERPKQWMPPEMLGSILLVILDFVQPFWASNLRCSWAYCSGVNPNLFAKLTWLAFSFIRLGDVLLTAGATTVLGFVRVSVLACEPCSSW